MVFRWSKMMRDRMGDGVGGRMEGGMGELGELGFLIFLIK